jgi:ketosteroid isomerase-like protein
MVASERLARRYFALFAGGRVDELVEILHPEVELTLKTSPGRVLRGPEDVARYVEEMSGNFYEAVPERFRPLDEERIVVEGRIRWAGEDRVLRDDPIVLALRFRDGLLLRSTPAQTVLEAETILAAGPDELSPP